MTIRVNTNNMRVEFGVGDRDAAVAEAARLGFDILNGDRQRSSVGPFEFSPDESRPARRARAGLAIPFQVSPGVFALRLRKRCP